MLIVRHQQVEDQAVGEVLDRVLREDRIELRRIDVDRDAQRSRRRAAAQSPLLRTRRSAQQREAPASAEERAACRGSSDAAELRVHVRIVVVEPVAERCGGPVRAAVTGDAPFIT